MNKKKVEEIFDSAFVSVTGKIASIELIRKTDQVLQCKNTYKESVYTTGAFDARIVCRFSPGIFENILLGMYGGFLPPDEEIPLYINEYVNITCGRAISELNNVLGVTSRLSVPNFYSMEELIGEEQKICETVGLCYESECGEIHILIEYIIQM